MKRHLPLSLPGSGFTLLALLFVAGCRAPTAPEPHAPVQQTAGARITFEYTGGEDAHPWYIQGELLAVEENGLVIVAHPSVEEARDGARSTLARVGFAGIRQLRVDGRQTTVQHPLGEAERLALASRARYPQGVGGELMRRLLEAYQQEQPVVLR